MSWLLVLVPVAIALDHFAPERYLLVFVASSIAILPLVRHRFRCGISGRMAPLAGLANLPMAASAERWMIA